ncbi:MULTISPECIES: MotA/TolQ/ExbB proton channel family protein [Pacificibacter]|uniref:MotA/TolQ/ExbB proton channel family protein n=1 Tax=Pacificibacter TaxID=1042323 RepID=UPI001C09CA60|nr:MULTISPECIES: MotA/TolQ/ExbB proton channel family protein [Pacificibacter]MBU2937775.1 MotA/TolQ/ExbB proton channel family protein [Pacificibacter marinus]MDO6616036.1 MotA/TolQ/ExbB proton channel family protein [Pacificibacter sp. 1_MG-2023]
MITLAQDRLFEIIALGGAVVAILLGFSVIALACILWKFSVFAVEGIGPRVSRGFARSILTQIAEAKANGVTEEALRARAAARLERDFQRAGSGLRLLDVISQVAPLLGLFGTVLGMIDAFRTLQEAGGTADPAVLAGGIWVALVTTAAGLIVAMPASMALSWFDGRLERFELVVRDALEEILSPQVFAQGAVGAIPARGEYAPA